MTWESINLPKISDIDLHPREKFFKARDRDGNVYKIFNPRLLRRWTDKDSRRWLSRPLPELLESGSRKTATRQKNADQIW